MSILNKTSEVQNASMAEFTKIVVPNEFVSRIIGKSGAIVRETQESSGVKKIDIQHESDMNMKVSMGLYGRSISIIGAIKNRNACVYSLLRQVCFACSEYSTLNYVCMFGCLIDLFYFVD